MNPTRDAYVAKITELNDSKKFYYERIAKLEMKILRSQSGGGLKSLSLEQGIKHLSLLCDKLEVKINLPNVQENYELYDKISTWKENVERQLAELKKSQRAKVNIFEFSYELIAEIKDRVSIADMVDQLNISRKRSGSNRYVLCCPFHDESTPSFMIYVEDDTYHCFGCQIHGDAIDFYQNTLGIEFDEALIQLSDKLGITIMDAEQVGTAEKMLNRYKEILHDIEEQIKSEEKNYAKGLVNANNN